MSKRSFRVALVAVLATVLALGVAVLYAWNTIKSYPTEARAGSGKPVDVEIERGMNFPQVAERLAERGVVDRPTWFRLYAMQRGVTTMVRPGDYTLRDDMTPEAVLDELLKGVKDVTVDVTVPEGLNMLEVFDLLAAAGVADRQALEATARDATFLKARGIDGDTVEGYLFPETYKFRKPSKPTEVLDKMIDQHRVVWDRVQRKHDKAITKLRKRLEWSDREILVMASIVEKEAVIESERPTIAQVFINRLTSPSFKSRRLETDPTIRYGCTVPLTKSEACKGWDKGRLRRAQLDDADNLYNTYQHAGLPPGPICSPGEKALEATVDPDGSDYFYFVAKDDHSHVFAKTFAEHDRNVDAYLRWRSENGN